MRLEGLNMEVMRLPGAMPVFGADVDAAEWSETCRSVAAHGGRLIALWGSDADREEYRFEVNVALAVRDGLVVLSDGGDNASRVTQEEAVRKAQASNAVIYTIALVIPGVRDANPTLLKELAQASGGQSFRPDTVAPQEIAEALGQIARDIPRTYTIGYTSTNTARDGAFRRVRVVVRAPPGQRLVVRSRAGYIAGIAKVEP